MPLSYYSSEKEQMGHRWEKVVYVLPLRMLTWGTEASKSFHRYVSNACTVWVTAAKRETKKEKMERCGEAMESQDCCPSWPCSDGTDGRKVSSEARAGTWAPQPAALGHANRPLRHQLTGRWWHQSHLQSVFLIPNALLTAGITAYVWDGEDQGMTDLSMKHIDRMTAVPKAFW